MGKFGTESVLKAAIVMVSQRLKHSTRSNSEMASELEKFVLNQRLRIDSTEDPLNFEEMPWLCSITSSYLEVEFLSNLLRNKLVFQLLDHSIKSVFRIW